MFVHYRPGKGDASIRHILKVGISPGAKSDVYDCLVLVDMVRFASYGVKDRRRADVCHLPGKRGVSNLRQPLVFIRNSVVVYMTL